MSGRHPFGELTRDFTPERRRRVDDMKQGLLAEMPLHELREARALTLQRALRNPGVVARKIPHPNSLPRRGSKSRPSLEGEGLFARVSTWASRRCDAPSTGGYYQTSDYRIRAVGELRPRKLRVFLFARVEDVGGKATEVANDGRVSISS